MLSTTGAPVRPHPARPLVAVVDRDHLAIIGSNWGRPNHPSWADNLLADPPATLTWRGRSVDVLAREVTAPDAERIWRRARLPHCGFRLYPARTQGRVIRAA